MAYWMAWRTFSWANAGAVLPILSKAIMVLTVPPIWVTPTPFDLAKSTVFEVSMETSAWPETRALARAWGSITTLKTTFL